jgi:hypothetical protein
MKLQFFYSLAMGICCLFLNMSHHIYYSVSLQIQKHTSKGFV